VSVHLKGNALTLVIPGQPEFELLPQPGDEFVLKQARMVSLRFLTDDKGNVKALELNQAGAIFEAARLEEKEENT